MVCYLLNKMTKLIFCSSPQFQLQGDWHMGKVCVRVWPNIVLDGSHRWFIIITTAIVIVYLGIKCIIVLPSQS